MNAKDIVVRRDGATATITLNRPDRLNALRGQTFVELQEAFASLGEDATVRVVVLTGQGRAFCAGADLKDLGDALKPQRSAERRGAIDRIQNLTRAMRRHPNITVAAINGPAIGFGAELPLACDLRVASNRARFAYPEATLGLFQTNGTLHLLPRLVGAGRAQALLLTGQELPAGEALRIGLVSHVFKHEVFDLAVQSLCERLCRHAPMSMRLLNGALRDGLTTVEAALEYEATSMLECLSSEDLQEGVDAFTQGRAPNFQGR